MLTDKEYNELLDALASEIKGNGAGYVGEMLFRILEGLEEEDALNIPIDLYFEYASAHRRNPVDIVDVAKERVN